MAEATCFSALGSLTELGPRVTEQNDFSVLVISPVTAFQNSLIEYFGNRSLETEVYSNSERAFNRLAERSFDLLVVDFSLVERNGLAFLGHVRARYPFLSIAILTAPNQPCSEHGARSEDSQQYNMPLLLTSGSGPGRSFEKNSPEEVALPAQQELSSRPRFDGIVGKSAPIMRVLDTVAQVAPSRSTVLLRGESGTGKELVARAIHENSQRKEQPFVPVNSAALPGPLLESILFGHVKGAFTTAVSDKKGLFEVADHGTLFLDEIADMPLDTQAKLLRVLQERSFMRTGGTHEIPVDVRVVAASSVDLRKLVQQNKFREDLYYRLNVIEIELPPLRKRREDIPELVDFFLKKFSRENGKPVPEMTQEALRRLQNYSWPGNVRELENAIQRAVVLCSGLQIGIEAFGNQLKCASLNFGTSLDELVGSWERHVILEMVKECNGNCAEAARRFSVPVSTLHRKIKNLKIKVKRHRH